MFSLPPWHHARNVRRMSKEVFEEGRDVRYGSTNPEKMDVKYWYHAERYGLQAWYSHDYFVSGNDPEEWSRRIREWSRRIREESYRRFADSDNKSEVEAEEEDVQEVKEEDVQEAEAAAVGEERQSTNEGEESPEEVDKGESLQRMRRPIWCSVRMGQTRTELPDGTMVKIAGEHEDLMSALHSL